jgi:hypothetical protein
VQTCGSVWHCPICSAKISNVRRGELNELLRWGRGRELIPLMVTLTGHHNAQMSLAESLAVMKRAKQSLHQSGPWKRHVGPMVEGHVTATEVNKSKRHGWHVHFHVLMLIEAASEAEAIELVTQHLEPEWLRQLERQGSWGGQHAFDVQGAADADRYVAKWGAAEELALSGEKRARGDAEIKGQTPWELLAAAADGDVQAGRDFVEYATWFHGKRQLVWSRGLKERVGLKVVEDDEAAGEQEDVADTAINEVAVLPKPTWRHVVRRRLRADLLAAARDGGYGAVAELLAQHGIGGAMPGGWRPMLSEYTEHIAQAA